MINALDRLLKTRIFHWIRISQFVVAIGVFSFAALMPATYVNSLDQSDHLMHFVGNLLLFVSASVACYGRFKLPLLILLLLPYSLLIELAQHYAPGRTVDPRDLIYNFAGLLSGLVLVTLVERGWRKINRANLSQVF